MLHAIAQPATTKFGRPANVVTGLATDKDFHDIAVEVGRNWNLPHEKLCKANNTGTSLIKNTIVNHSIKTIVYHDIDTMVNWNKYYHGILW